MIIDMQEARDTLRVDGKANDDIIEPLVQAIPAYLEQTTGKRWEDEDNNELAQTTAKFILQLWFDNQSPDAERLKRTINTLLVALTTLGRSIDNGS